MSLIHIHTANNVIQVFKKNAPLIQIKVHETNSSKCLTCLLNDREREWEPTWMFILDFCQHAQLSLVWD